MICQQQTAAADAPAMKAGTMAAAHGLSSSCFCAAVAETAAAGEAAAAAATAAASSGSYCFCAAAAETVASDSVDSAKIFRQFVYRKGVRDLSRAPFLFPYISHDLFPPTSYDK